MNLEDKLAAALVYAIHNAHPVYGNTTGWRGGIGGQAMTQGCSFIDPPPGEEWLQYNMIDEVLREYLEKNPDAKLQENAKALAQEMKERLEKG